MQSSASRDRRAMSFRANVHNSSLCGLSDRARSSNASVNKIAIAVSSCGCAARNATRPVKMGSGGHTADLTDFTS